jgi:hypothetical protein
MKCYFLIDLLKSLFFSRIGTFLIQEMYPGASYSRLSGSLELYVRFSLSLLFNSRDNFDLLQSAKNSNLLSEI